MSRGCYDAGTGKEVWKMNDYDERQILARGRAFMWGFFTLMLCLMAYGFTDMLIEPWCDTLTGCIICICVSLLVFASICIRQDAFAGIGRNRKRNQTVLLVLTLVNLMFGVSHVIDGDLLREGLLCFRSVNLIVGVTTGLVLLVFAVGVFSQTGYLLLVSLLFGGNASTIAPLLVLSLKVATCSLASVTVFSGLDPDKLSNGLMWFGCPERLSFSISYAYRVLPMLMEEFQNILLSFRLRGNPPSRESLWGKVKYLFYQVKVVMHAFYPLMLNTAKRSRTTVEALEIRGYRNAATNKAVKRMKLATLKVSTNDLLFLAISLLWISLAILLSTLI